MVLPSETVYTVLKTQKIPQQQSGIGRIEITGNGVFLKTSMERIALDVPDGSELQYGQTVRFTVKNDTVQITPVPPDARQTLNLPADLFTLSESDAVAPVSSTVHPTGIFPVENREPGIYLVSSVDDLGTFTTTRFGKETLELITTRLAADGLVALRVGTGADGALRAVIWPVRDLPIALQQLSASFTSTLLSSVPVDLLGQVLANRGNLPLTPLLQLDVLMKNVDSAFPVIRAGSAQAQSNALVQWFHSALLFETPSDSIASLAPHTSAGTMMSDLEPVLAPLSEPPGWSLPASGTFSLPGLPASERPDGSDLIAQAASRIGFTLEHMLAAADADQNHYPPQQTLKSLLLHLIHTLTPESNEPMIAKADGKIPLPQQGATLSIDTPPAVLASKSEALATTLSGLRSTIGTMISRIPQNTSDNADTLPAPSFPVAPATMSYSSAATPPASEAVPRIDPLPLQYPLFTLKILLAETAVALASYREPTGTAGPSDSVASRLSDTIRALTPAVEASTLADGGTSAAARETIHKSTIILSPALLPLLRSTLDAVNTMIRVLQNNRSAAATGQPNGNFPRERVTIGQMTSDGGGPADEFPRQLGRALGTALDRLESLQLLARQVPTTQGTQQIIALPIKFGETWTEINVRFLHHKKKRHAQKGSAHLSVAVDVAPPALGAIHANLDYRPSRDLHLTADFERKTTRTWFVNHRDELQNALQRTGIAVVRVDFRHTRQKHSSSAHPESGADTALIDMTA